MTKDPIFLLCDRVRETAFALHKYHRHGHAEKTYENGLAHRLRKQGLKVVQQHPLHVCDEDGTVAPVLLHRHRDMLYRVYEGHIGEMSAVPFVAVPMHEIAAQSLDHRGIA